MNQIEWPIFVFRDDPVVEMCESLEDARRDYEGIDVEAGVYSFFDFTGKALKAVFLKPNRHGSIFGVIRSVSSGVFALEHNSEATRDELESALARVEILDATDRFMSIDSVRQHFYHEIAKAEQVED